MFRSSMPRPRGRLALVIGVTAIAMLLSSCGASSGSGSAADSAAGAGHGPSSTSSVSYAWPVSQKPNWIMPLGTPGHSSTLNSSLIDLMWTPLFAYNSTGGTMGLDKRASLAKDITFSADGKKATVTLKDMSWSDGVPVTTRDVEFWYNLVKHNKKKWSNYVAGRIPDSVEKFTTVDEKTFTMVFDRAYNQDWLKSNQLALIRPMPQHAWDKTSDAGPIGNHDRTAAGAKAVFSYLVKAAKSMSTYDTNELWETTNGPYTLSKFSTAGRVVLSKNKHYDGTDPATIQTVKLLPFTSTSAEENALRSHELDYGYIAAGTMPQKEQFEESGYTVTPKPGWSITYMPYNFNNPQMGAVFSQLYARQAIQMSVDQKGISEVIWHDTAEPGYGPVPQGNDSAYLSKTQRNNPYPYDPQAAQKLLTDHGWTIGDDGVATCTSAGTGPSDCGAGIEEGKRFEITVLSQSGSTETDNMMNAIRSGLSLTGIDLNVKSAPVNSVLAQTQACEPEDGACSWQLSFFGSSGSWYFPAYPTGEKIFATSGQSNFGQYSNPQADQLIEAAILSDDGDAMKKFSALLAKDLPVVWMPNPVYQVAVTADGLHGTAQDVDQIYPQRWSW